MWLASQIICKNISHAVSIVCVSGNCHVFCSQMFEILTCTLIEWNPFLLMYPASFTEGALIGMWVPSTIPSVLGIPALAWNAKAFSVICSLKVISNFTDYFTSYNIPLKPIDFNLIIYYMYVSITLLLETLHNHQRCCTRNCIHSQGISPMLPLRVHEYRHHFVGLVLLQKTSEQRKSEMIFFFLI